MREIKNGFRKDSKAKTYSKFLQELETKEEMDCGANLCGANVCDCGINSCALRVLPCGIHVGPLFR